MSLEVLGRLSGWMGWVEREQVRSVNEGADGPRPDKRNRDQQCSSLPPVRHEIAEKQDGAHGHLARHPALRLVAAVHPEASAGVVHVHLHVPAVQPSPAQPSPAQAEQWKSKEVSDLFNQYLGSPRGDMMAM